MKSNRNHISPSVTPARQSMQANGSRKSAKQIVRKASNPTRMTMSFSIPGSEVPKAWEYLLEAIREFEERHKVSLDDLDIKSIPVGIVR